MNEYWMCVLIFVIDNLAKLWRFFTFSKYFSRKIAFFLNFSENIGKMSDNNCKNDKE